MLTQTKRDISITAVAIAAVLVVGLLLVSHAAKADEQSHQLVKGQHISSAIVCTQIDMINDLVAVIDNADEALNHLVAESAERYCMLVMGADLVLEHPFGMKWTAYDGLPVEKWIVSGFQDRMVGYAVVWPTHPDTVKADDA